MPLLDMLDDIEQSIPGCLMNNPKCSSCGYRMKRIYATYQIKTQYSKRKFRSKHKPVGWACFSCGHTEYDGGIIG